MTADHLSFAKQFITLLKKTALSIPTLDKSEMGKVLKQILGSLNVASKHWVIRQYDHEVQAGSAVKPLVGPQCDGPSDAAVVRPRWNSHRGLVLSNGMNPYFGDFDTYHMAASAIDEAVRNAIAVGADPQRIAILDNFCWGYTDRQETLGSLVRAAIACKDVALSLGTPFISGKDSLNNEFTYVDSRGDKQTIAIPASLLISAAMGQVEDVRKCVTMDCKEAGNGVYLVGQTRDELGGSHFALVQGLSGGSVPKVDLALQKPIFEAMHQAIQQGLVRARHDLSEGGLAVAAAEMAFAGELGMELDLAALQSQQASRELGPVPLLFSESNTRFLVEVSAGCEEAFRAIFEGLPCGRLGHVTEKRDLQINLAGQTVLDEPLAALKKAWQSPLNW